MGFLLFAAVDTEQGQVMCFACRDYIYDPEIDAIARRAREKSRKVLGLEREYQQWEPSDLEISLLRSNPKRRRPTPNSTIGNEIRA